MFLFISLASNTKEAKFCSLSLDLIFYAKKQRLRTIKHSIHTHRQAMEQALLKIDKISYGLDLFVYYSDRNNQHLD